MKIVEITIQVITLVILKHVFLNHLIHHYLGGFSRKAGDAYPESTLDLCCQFCQDCSFTFVLYIRVKSVILCFCCVCVFYFIHFVCSLFLEYVLFGYRRNPGCPDFRFYLSRLGYRYCVVNDITVYV